MTIQAINQIEEIMQYISTVLMNSRSAHKWSKTLQTEISKLDFIPNRYHLVENEPWHSKGLHQMPIKDYLVYYLIDEEEKTVWITAVIYTRRDQILSLLEMY